MFKRYPVHSYYWFCQAIGWILFYISQMGFIYGFGKYNTKVAGYYFIVVLIGFCLTHTYRYLIIRWGWLNFNLPRILVRVVPSVLLLSLLWILIDEGVDKLFFQFKESDATLKEKISIWTIYFAVWFNTAVILFLWSLLYFGFHFFKTYKQSEIEKWKLEASAKEAELLALKSQINPHFIFNSLNNIRSLVIEDPDKARNMITHLSDLLRYSIQINNQEKVTLEKELEVVRDYLQLESIQFEERLKFSFEIEENTLHFQIPPMVVQILVENAIKHGIADLPEGGEILIKACLEDNQLKLEVINTGQLQEKTQGTGVGLKNASQRLQLLFKTVENIKLKKLDNNKVSAGFSISIG